MATKLEGGGVKATKIKNFLAASLGEVEIYSALKLPISFLF